MNQLELDGLNQMNQMQLKRNHVEHGGFRALWNSDMSSMGDFEQQEENMFNWLLDPEADLQGPWSF